MEDQLLRNRIREILIENAQEGGALLGGYGTKLGAQKALATKGLVPKKITKGYLRKLENLGKIPSTKVKSFRLGEKNVRAKVKRILSISQPAKKVVKKVIKKSSGSKSAQATKVSKAKLITSKKAKSGLAKYHEFQRAYKDGVGRAVTRAEMSEAWKACKNTR